GELSSWGCSAILVDWDIMPYGFMVFEPHGQSSVQCDDIFPRHQFILRECSHRLKLPLAAAGRAPIDVAGDNGQDRACKGEA
ncbi:hypothetical protein Dimus_036265, partial [Dionaea muscipula]